MPMELANRPLKNFDCLPHKLVIAKLYAGVLRNRLTEVGKNMFNLGSKTSPRSQILVFPVIFETIAEALRQENFLDLHVIVFVKNGHRFLLF